MNPSQTPPEQLLSMLQDIHLPDPVGWWPFSYSIWVLLFSLSALLLALLWTLRERHQRAAYRRQALQALTQIVQNPKLEAAQQVLQINALLKQVAITAYGRQAVAVLSHQAWLDFLKRCAEFVAQPEEALAVLESAYQAEPALNSTQLTAWQHYARDWIKGHHL
jgi:hypothetical protein